MNIMHKVFLSIFVAALFCSCATIKLENTVWYSENPSERDGVRAEVITTLLFAEDSVVAVQTSVKQSRALLVSPCFTEYGTYSYSGDLINGIKINMNTITVEGDSVKYEGIICRKGMVLVSQDSKVKGYKMAKNYQLKEK